MAAATKERPILFSGAMVRPILDGRKSATRRVVKGVSGKGDLDPDFSDDFPKAGLDRVYFEDGHAVFEYQTRVDDTDKHYVKCPYGKPGDRLWVRETFVTGWAADSGSLKTIDGDGNEIPEQVWYRASETDFTWLDSDGYMTDRVPWKSPLFMPRSASRILLEITEVRVERLQEITEADAIAEGFRGTAAYTAKQEFANVWETLNAKRGFPWELNPWVWVISFKRITEAGS